MPAFETPKPITATLDLVLGDADVHAGAGRETVVDVQPSDPARREDVEAAAATRVELADGKLLVRAPRPRAWWSRDAGGSVDVAVTLPTGSYLRATAGSADVRCAGRLGDCRIKTGLGSVRVEEADTLFLRSGAGDVSVERVTGHAEVATGSGDVRMTTLDRGGVVRNANGDVWIGTAAGDVRVKAGNGAIAVDRATAGVDARSANGDVRLREAVRGTVTLATHAGDVEVGVAPGSAAWLDVHATGGRVLNALDAADAPEAADERLEVRARTSLGNVVVRRP